MSKKERVDYTEKKKFVDELVNANEENTPEYSEEELNRYKSKSGLKLTSTSKALLLKFWFSGVVCYFVVWGLGVYLATLDLIFVTCVVMGFVKDILENNIFRFLADPPGSNDKWMMFPKKGYMSLIFNVLYAFLVMFCVYCTYAALNTVLYKLTGGSTAEEPFTFGLFYLAYDLLFIKMKHVGQKIIADARKKAKGGE